MQTGRVILGYNTSYHLEEVEGEEPGSGTVRIKMCDKCGKVRIRLPDIQ